MNNNPASFENMTAAEFEHRLPDLFANGDGRVSDDPSLQKFLQENPTCAALVRDLEYIAETAKHLLDPAEETPSDNVWSKIQSKLKIAASGEEPE